MKKSLNILALFLLLMTLYSCDKKSAVAREFSCQHTAINTPTERVNDFKNAFSIKLPKHWNTKLYYDNNQSELFSADTLQTIEHSIIVNAAMIYNTITLDDTFKNNLESVTHANGLTTLQYGSLAFDGYDGYYHLGKGVDKNMPIQVMQWYIKCDNQHYFRYKVDIYGNTNTHERLCRAMGLVETLTINKQ